MKPELVFALCVIGTVILVIIAFGYRSDPVVNPPKPPQIQFPVDTNMYKLNKKLGDLMEAEGVKRPEWGEPMEQAIQKIITCIEKMKEK